MKSILDLCIAGWGRRCYCFWRMQPLCAWHLSDWIRSDAVMILDLGHCAPFWDDMSDHVQSMHHAHCAPCFCQAHQDRPLLHGVKPLKAILDLLITPWGCRSNYLRSMQPLPAWYLSDGIRWDAKVISRVSLCDIFDIMTVLRLSSSC
jgi:hypothetical protein